MIDRKDIQTIILAVTGVILWAVYFAICSSPGGAPFIYVDF